MGKRRRFSWSLHLIGCFNRGLGAYRAGKPRDACPYATGYRGHGCRYNGGNLQGQRADYWLRGWDHGKENPETESKESGSTGE